MDSKKLNAHSSKLIAAGKRLHRFDVVAAWYREHLSIHNYRHRTIKDYCFELSFFRRWLQEQTDTADIDDIESKTLHDYAAHLHDLQRAPKTIHHKLAALSNFFGAVYEEKKLYADMRKHITLPRLSKKLPGGLLTEEETKRCFDYLESATDSLRVHTLGDAVLLRDRAVFEVLYSTAMRREEVKKIKPGDIDFDNGLVFTEGKGGKDRVVPVGKKCLEAIRHYLNESRPFMAAADCMELFVTRRGYGMGDYTIRQAVINVTHTAGIQRHIKVHAMRHTCATHMLNSGADIRYVQEMLGHASLSSTQVYTHVSIGKLKETHKKHHPREQACTEPAESEE